MKFIGPFRFCNQRLTSHTKINMLQRIITQEYTVT